MNDAPPDPRPRKKLTRKKADALSFEDEEQLRNSIANAPPGRILTATEVGIYLQVCYHTLARNFGTGKGKLEPIGGIEARGKGKPVRFRKEDVDRFMSFAPARDSHWTGRFQTIDDVVREEPWVVIRGRVWGHLREVGDIDTAIELLEADEIQVHRLDDALQLPWDPLEARVSYEKALRSIFERALGAINAACERGSLAADTAAATGPSRDRNGSTL